MRHPHFGLLASRPGREKISGVLSPRFVVICCTARGHSHAALYSTKLSHCPHVGTCAGALLLQRSLALPEAASPCRVAAGLASWPPHITVSLQGDRRRHWAWRLHPRVPQVERDRS